MARPFGIYVHFPYCTHRCPYCDFAVTTERPPARGEYARAILAELALRAPSFSGLDARSVYLGGGTPSLWDPDDVGEVLTALRARFSIPPGAEVTIEVNPESSSRERLLAWRRAGVNRVSVGVQSFDPGVLAKLGRRHGADLAEQAIRDAADVVGNASVDLIYAARRSTVEIARADATRAVGAGACHVSAYALTLDADVLAEEVPLARLRAQGRLTLPDDDEASAQARAIEAAVRRAGLRRYEISNFARAGAESVHNRLYWEGESYLGLGAGAYGCVRGEEGALRYGNLRDAGRWRAAVLEGALPTAEEDRIAPGAERNERLMLALRMRRGAPLAALSLAQAREAEALVAHRLAVRRAGRLVLTRRGMEVHSAVAERLFE
ncbi:coproporphyrinogen-III oxidase family protein [Anaeromyxobacter oryzae]|uniref:Heme chaperone HemW n=1 Tax=Anaeromyxobacter oryzae TaxID=2918170 RepID=A0ABM7WWH3_9BACT|nr:coproporphyrinogen-III oxidase family protein [Anaeromyxobacter oryzae]BDG03802.1 coproporphyrinogen III oxidase [Anaeromyxobacter oryzae]